MPTWPRRMQADLAAAYCGVSVGKFLSGVRAGKYPQATKDGGNKLWDIRRLDEALDKLSGLDSPSGKDDLMGRIHAIQNEAR